MDRDELIRALAEVVAGMQVPLSIGLPLGTATDPLRKLMSLLPGWSTEDEYEALLKEVLG